jgi:hypothetical protein
MALRIRRSFTRGTLRSLSGSIGFDGSPLIVCEFVANDSSHFRIADARRTRFLVALAKQAIYRRPLFIGTLVAVPTQQLAVHCIWPVKKERQSPFRKVCVPRRRRVTP